MRPAFILVLFMSSALCSPGSKLTISRDISRTADKGSRITALTCTEDLQEVAAKNPGKKGPKTGECKVLRILNGVTEKSAPISVSQARELLANGASKLAPFATASDDPKCGLRWAVSFKKESFQGCLGARTPSDEKPALRALIWLESKLNTVLD